MNQPPITGRLSAQVESEIKTAQTALIGVVSSIKNLATRTLALRGHTDNEGNLYELLQLRADDVPEMKVWLKRKNK